MKAPKTAQREFEEFAEKVGIMRDEVPEVQRTEMRRAFFAGQLSMFSFQMNEIVNLSDDEAERAMAARRDELYAYFKANFQQRN